MRLIDVDSLIYDDEPRLVDFADEKKLPKYAILSHRWEEEEVLYQDFVLGPQHEIATSHSNLQRSRAQSSNTRNDLSSESDESWAYDESDERSIDLSSDVESTISSNSWQTESSSPINAKIGPHIKRGWNKVLNASLKACRDGYHFLWIDTCCIDKTSSSELSEAINSMFRWYSIASTCYAYLSDCKRSSSAKLCGRPPGADYFKYEPRTKNANHRAEKMYNVPNYVRKLVEFDSDFATSAALGYWRLHLRASSPKSIGEAEEKLKVLKTLGEMIYKERELDDHTLQSLRSSQWFRRGWTLQELLAPGKMDFYDGNWDIIGSKVELLRVLSSTTGIHIPALCGEYMFFSTAQRMSWYGKRRTTRLEDEAYCLFGIFGVNMPLLYGEGREAFQRLQREIIQTSTDTSIFAWDFRRYPDGGEHRLFAPSPRGFLWHAGDVSTCEMSSSGSEMSLSNQGLRISLPLLPWIGQYESNDLIALLDCHSDGSKWIGLRLAKTPDGTVSLNNEDGADETGEISCYAQPRFEHMRRAPDAPPGHSRLVHVSPYRHLGVRRRILISLHGAGGPAAVEDDVRIRDGDGIVVRFLLPSRRTTNSRSRIVASFPPGQLNEHQRSMTFPTRAFGAFGAVAIQQTGMADSIYFIVFRVGEAANNGTWETSSGASSCTTSSRNTSADYTSGDEWDDESDEVDTNDSIRETHSRIWPAHQSSIKRHPPGPSDGLFAADRRRVYARNHRRLTARVPFNKVANESDRWSSSLSTRDTDPDEHDSDLDQEAAEAEEIYHNLDSLPGDLSEDYDSRDTTPERSQHGLLSEESDDSSTYAASLLDHLSRRSKCSQRQSTRKHHHYQWIFHKDDSYLEDEAAKCPEPSQSPAMRYCLEAKQCISLEQQLQRACALAETCFLARMKFEDSATQCIGCRHRVRLASGKWFEIGRIIKENYNSIGMYPVDEEKNPATSVSAGSNQRSASSHQQRSRSGRKARRKSLRSRGRKVEPQDLEAP